MDNEKTAVDDFLNEVNEVKDDDFKDEEVFKDEVKEEEKEEKPIAFHKDPKVQKYVQKQIEKALKDIKPSATEEFIKETASEESDDLVSAMERIIGNDTPEKVHALKMLKKTVGEMEDKASQKAINALQRERQQEVEAEAEATEELASGFENIEEEFGVDLTSNSAQAVKTRNDFVDFIKLVAPKDKEGQVTDYPDLTRTFEVFQSMKKSEARPNRAKEIASRSMARSSEVSVGVPKGGPKNWDEFQRMINK